MNKRGNESELFATPTFAQSNFIKRSELIELFKKDKPIKYKRRIAFHIAGHAVAIYANIKAKNLPPVFYRVMLKALNNWPEKEAKTAEYGRLRPECGLITDRLPLSLETPGPSIDGLYKTIRPSIKEAMAVFEADIVHLLAGPLAEAKHVAETDDEIFSAQLINLKALQNYGGGQDIVLANENLQRFSTSLDQQQEKLEVLFDVTFQFINEQVNWAAITQLARYVLSAPKNKVGYDEVVSILEH